MCSISLNKVVLESVMFEVSEESTREVVRVWERMDYGEMIPFGTEL